LSLIPVTSANHLVRSLGSVLKGLPLEDALDVLSDPEQLEKLEAVKQKLQKNII